MRTILFAMLMSTVVIGCGKKKEGDGGGDTKTTEKDKGAPAADLPALTADPEPAKITPAETPPAESVKWRMPAKRGQGGWPTFDAYNLGTKPIAFMPIYGYAYDKDGKQLARTRCRCRGTARSSPATRPASRSTSAPETCRCPPQRRPSSFATPASSSKATRTRPPPASARTSGRRSSAMKKRRTTKTPKLDAAAQVLERQRKRAARVLLKRRRQKSGQ